jgi:arylsulfatase A
LRSIERASDLGDIVSYDKEVNMNLKNSAGILLAFLLSVSCQAAKASSPKSSAKAEKPNIVLLLIDDWAWNGTPVAMDDAMENSRMPVLRMPNVERLARAGMKFRNAYASPQCSPARVCVQTGQSTPRNGFSVFMNDRGQEYYNEKQYKGFPVVSCISDMTIDDDAVTIPEALKPLGYASAHVGKWHMRGDPGDEGYALHDGNTSNNPGNTLPPEKKKRLPASLTDPKLMFSLTESPIGLPNATLVRRAAVHRLRRQDGGSS